ncbi:MAG TPA: hypothetical protein V6C97_21090 [Oculatellaceae cyanobacterium]
MKRFFAALVAVMGLALIGVGPAHALPTQAQCPVSNINTTYPTNGHIYDCHSYNPTDFTNLGYGMDHLETGTVPFFNTFANAGYGAGIPIYYVQNATVAQALFGHQPPPGECAFSPTAAPWYVVVLHTCPGFTVARTLQQELIAVDHEFGHVWNDNHPFGAAPWKGIYPDATTGAGSFDFYVEHDFYNIDFEDQAGQFPRPPCGVGHIFEGVQDPAHGNAYICLDGQLQYPYTTKTTNGQILQYILPYFFTTSLNVKNLVAWDELYPEEFGIAESAGTGGDTTALWDQFITAWFPCSSAGWPNIAVYGGTLPPNNEPQTCSFTLPANAHNYR